MKVLFVASEAAPFLKTGGLADVAHSLPKYLKKSGVDIRVIMPKYGKISEEFKEKMDHIAEYTVPVGADVAHSLPKYLKKSGVDIRVIMPKYGKISEEFKEKMDHIAEYTVPVGWRNQYCGLDHLKHDGIDFYFMDNEYYFKRNEPYGHFDDGEIFSFFSRGVLESIKHIENFIPDVIHCNDWHTGMVPVLLDAFYRYDVRFQNIKTVYTIHNLKYQGIFSKTVLNELLGLDDSYFTEDKLKFYDAISFMKGGIIYSDIVNTVSQSYADEIRTPYYGENLDGLLNSISGKLYGIVNGIDHDAYNPRRDKNIPKTFGLTTMKNKLVNKAELQKQISGKLYGIVNGIDHDAYNPRRDKNIPKTFGLTTMKNKLVNKAELQKQLGHDAYNPRRDKNIPKTFGLTTMKNKLVNKAELQKQLGLPVDKDIPVIGLVSRLVSQKGLDLIKGVIEEILNLDMQLVILGTGDQAYEDLFEYYSHIYPKKLSSNIGFSDKLAKLIYAGADMFLMPSLFEDQAYEDLFEYYSHIYPKKLSSNIGFSDKLAKLIYAGADMFLMPSLFEPCGIGQLIALRYGTVPIVRETGGLKDTITPYNKYTGEGNGFSFTNYNAHDMLNVIQLAVLKIQ